MQKCLAVVLSSFFLLFVPLRALAIDYSDIWFLPAESGWGVNLIQNEDVIFATFFVYGPNNQPTWFVAVMNRDGNGNFTGNLYTTVGSYYGGPWNPAANSETLAGTASFVPSDPYSGTLSYSLTSGPTVVKPIQRQTLRTIVLGGTYSGGQVGAYSGSSCSLGNYVDHFDVQVTQPGDGTATFMFAYEDSGLSCTLSGTLQQKGMLYSIPNASYSCSDGLNTSASLTQIKATSLGIEGILAAPSVAGGCREDATFSGALQ
jgi:hypothetical protein